MKPKSQARPAAADVCVRVLRDHVFGRKFAHIISANFLNETHFQTLCSIAAR